jgi:hypothetical protein
MRRWRKYYGFDARVATLQNVEKTLQFPLDNSPKM